MTLLGSRRLDARSIPLTNGWGISAFVLPLTVGTALIAALLSGSLVVERFPGLGEAGAFTRALLLVSRAAATVSAVLTAGLLVTAVLGTRPSGRPPGRGRRQAGPRYEPGELVTSALRLARRTGWCWAASASIQSVAAAAVAAALGMLQFVTNPAAAWSTAGLSEVQAPAAQAVLAAALSIAIGVERTGLLAGADTAPGVGTKQSRPGRGRRERMSVAPLLWLLVLTYLGLAVGLLVGHAAAAAAPFVAVGLLSLHVMAAAAWVGGLVALVTLTSRRPLALTVLAPRFSGMALTCVAVLAITGLLAARRELPAWGALTDSAYGRLVLTKAVLLLLLVAGGAAHRRFTLPRLSTRGDGRALLQVALVEVALMALVLGLATALATTGPP